MKSCNFIKAAKDADQAKTNRERATHSWSGKTPNQQTASKELAHLAHDHNPVLNAVILLHHGYTARALSLTTFSLAPLLQPLAFVTSLHLHCSSPQPQYLHCKISAPALSLISLSLPPLPQPSASLPSLYLLCSSPQPLFMSSAPALSFPTFRLPPLLQPSASLSSSHCTCSSPQLQFLHFRSSAPASICLQYTSSAPALSLSAFTYHLLQPSASLP